MSLNMSFIKNYNIFINENISDVKFIKQYIEKTNPHTGSRDAFQGIGRLSDFTWNVKQTLIQPDDKKIDLDDLYPASKLDVKRYKKAYLKGSEFPPIVLVDKGNKYTILDGAHRLKAAIELDVPIRAYIGYEIKNK
jgi:hypothetical protein